MGLFLLACGVDRSLEPTGTTDVSSGSGSGSPGGSGGGGSGSGSGGEVIGSGSGSGSSSGSGSGGSGSSSGSGSGSGSGSSSGSSSGSGSGSSSGVTSADCDDGGACTAPPPPSGVQTTGATALNFALHHIHLGDELDSQGQPDWYQYGYNIDGLDTTATSTNVCGLYQNANPKNQIDGPGGIDNSFGENIVVSLLSAALANPSATVNASLAQGSYTLMLDVTGLLPTAGQTATGLSGMLFDGAPFNQSPNASTAVPTWTTADDWPLAASSVASATNGAALVPPVASTEPLVGSYVVSGVFVSGKPTDVTLSIPLAGTELVLPIQHAVITFDYPCATSSGTATTHVSGGIISGVIDAQALVTNFQIVAGTVSSSLCQTSVYQQVANAILQSADILDDGSNVSGTPCNGISVGIGFDADEIAPPEVVGATTQLVSPCFGGP
jgi:hypothetical protein